MRAIEDDWIGFRIANDHYTLAVGDFDFVADRDMTWQAALRWFLGLFKCAR